MEELNVDLTKMDHYQCLGELDTQIVIEKKLTVSPFVFYQLFDDNFELNDKEVRAIRWVPLEYFNIENISVYEKYFIRKLRFSFAFQYPTIEGKYLRSIDGNNIVNHEEFNDGMIETNGLYLQTIEQLNKGFLEIMTRGDPMISDVKAFDKDFFLWGLTRRITKNFLELCCDINCKGFLIAKAVNDDFDKWLKKNGFHSKL